MLKGIEAENHFCIHFHFLATTTECDLCNKNGKCVPDEASVVRCECRPWFAGRNCQINLKLLLIVGCVSVILMIVIACGVSCFCCRDRQHGKDSIPCKFPFLGRFFCSCSPKAFFLMHLFYSSLWNECFKNARKYGKATWIHDGPSCWRWKAKGNKTF